MPPQKSPSARNDESPHGDPWIVVGYLLSGVLFYGLLGWLADRWLGTSFVVAIGILVGAVLGVYLTYARFNGSVVPGVTGSRDEQD